MLNHQVFKYEIKASSSDISKKQKFKNPNPSSCAFKNTFKEERLSLRHTYDYVGFLTLKPFKIRGIEEKDDSEPRKMNLATHD